MSAHVHSGLAGQTPTQPRALIAWAEGRGLKSYLDASAPVAIRAHEREPSDVLDDCIHLLYGLTAREILLEGVRDYYGLHHQQKRSVRAALHAGLLAADAQLESRRQLERMVNAGRRPADPVRRALADRLVEKRMQLRATVPIAHVVPLGRARVEDGARPTFVVEVPNAVIGGKSVRASIPIALDDPEVGAPTCVCGDRPCTRKLAAIDALLALLFLPPNTADPQLEAALSSIGTLQWERSLARLDHTIAELKPPPEGAAIHWEVFHDGPWLRARPLLQQIGKRGVMLAPKPIGLQRLAALDLPLEPADRHLLDVLTALEKQPSWHARAHNRLAAALVGHPRLRDRNGEPVTAVQHSVGVTVVPAGEGFELLAAAGGHSWPASELLQWMGPSREGALVHLLTDDGRLEVLVLSDRTRKVLETIALFGGYVPAERADALVARLARLGGAMPVSAPPELGFGRVDGDTRLVARLTPSRERVGLTVELLARAHPDAPAYLPGRGPREVIAIERGSQQSLRCVVRDLDEEVELARDLAREVLGDETAMMQFVPDREHALALVAQLRGAPGVEIEWPTKRSWKIHPAKLDDLRLVVSGGNGLFDLKGGATVGGRMAQLALLLDAVRTDRRYVALGDDSFVELDDEVRRHLQPLASVVHERQGQLLMPGVAIEAARKTFEVAGEVDACRAWTEALATFDEVRTYQPAVPPAFREVLRPYQREGFCWLARLARLGAGACLADEMGLGKTVQALALIAVRADDGPTLVVAPTSVCFNWERESRRFAPELRPLLYMGRDRGALLAGLRARDVLIVSYAVLARDAELLASVPFATLVLDEAQAIKNFDTRRARAARKIQAGFRLALSGTPVENHLGELWSLFDVIVPGLLGSWWEFRERLREANAAGDLAAIVRPFLLRRTKHEVAPELPPRSETVIDVLLERDERATYESARLAAATALEGMNGSLTPQQARVRLLSALTRLRQLTCHSGLDDPTSSPRSSKIDSLVEMLRPLVAEGRRALVFSQFTRLLGRVATVLGGEKIRFVTLDGSTPATERARLVEEFQQGDIPVFLISLKAGGTGLNLTAADTVFHLDPWWNPAVEDQATDRAHRIGQTRPVSIYRFVARDTVEEAVLRLHERKRSLAGQILDGAEAAGALSTAELVELVHRRAA